MYISQYCQAMLHIQKPAATVAEWLEAVPNSIHRPVGGGEGGLLSLP